MVKSIARDKNECFENTRTKIDKRWNVQKLKWTFWKYRDQNEKKKTKNTRTKIVFQRSSCLHVVTVFSIIIAKPRAF